jgi:hypothetical protein
MNRKTRKHRNHCCHGSRIGERQLTTRFAIAQKKTELPSVSF